MVKRKSRQDTRGGRGCRPRPSAPDSPNCTGAGHACQHQPKPPSQGEGPGAKHRSRAEASGRFPQRPEKAWPQRSQLAAPSSRYKGKISHLPPPDTTSHLGQMFPLILHYREMRIIYEVRSQEPVEVPGAAVPCGKVSDLLRWTSPWTPLSHSPYLCFWELENFR